MISLNLTPDQREKVAACISPRARRNRAQAAWTYDDHVNLTRKAIAVLSDRQRDLWIHVLGPPADSRSPSKQRHRNRPSVTQTQPPVR